jgi:hypothetical protein
MLRVSIFYLGHHQVNSIKQKPSYLNLLALIWAHIVQPLVVAIISEYILTNVNNIYTNQNKLVSRGVLFINIIIRKTGINEVKMQITVVVLNIYIK